MAITAADNIRGQMPPENFSEAAAEKSRSPGSSKIFRLFIILAFFVLGVELIWFLGITPFRPFSRIEITGLTHYDHESLLAYAGITPQSSFIFTNTREIETAIAALPQIESVRVFKRFPGRLDIVIQNRSASAVAFASSGGITVPVLFDRQGVIFQIGSDNIIETVADLPVISGLIIEQPVLGMRLPARFFMLLEDLDAIRMNAPELLSAVSEIRIDRRSAEGFELTLFLLHPRMKVRVSGLTEDLLRYTLLVADVLSVREPEIDMIDFRGAVASYFPKGGNF